MEDSKNFYLLSGLSYILCGILYIEAKETPYLEGGTIMKGYYNNTGYMGYVDGKWVLFASEQDYLEYMED